jgi:hypothetical protein
LHGVGAKDEKAKKRRLKEQLPTRASRHSRQMMMLPFLEAKGGVCPS